MIERNVFKNQNEIDQHIESKEKEKISLSDESRTLELKNWLEYISD